MTRKTQARTQREAEGRSRLALIALAFVLAASAFATAACSQGTPAASESTAPAASESPATSGAAPEASATPAVTELQINDTKVGTGEAAKTGDTVTVDYTGYLMDGTKFDSSVGSGQPFTFKLGEGRVIEGWDKGVVGMKVGGTRVLVIPSSMAYGEQGAANVIPPNAPLKFEVKMFKIEPAQ